MHMETCIFPTHISTHIHTAYTHILIYAGVFCCWSCERVLERELGGAEDCVRTCVHVYVRVRVACRVILMNVVRGANSAEHTQTQTHLHTHSHCLRKTPTCFWVFSHSIVFTFFSDQRARIVNLGIEHSNHLQAPSNRLWHL